MSMSEDTGAEKPHEATPKRLEDLRRKGDVPRSAELTTGAAYAGFVLATAALGPAAVASLGEVLILPLDRAAGLADIAFAGSPAPLIGGLILATAAAVLPFFLLPPALALLSVLGQQALVFAPEKLQPKLSRLSPLTGIKQKFGRAGLFEFLKSFAKLLLYGLILGWYLARKLPELLVTPALTAGQVALDLSELAMGLMLLVLAVALPLGALDLLFQRADFARRNRMSLKELRDEHKEAEGDPHLKHQRRQKGVEIAMNRMIAEVPKADVVIVNPTHYAVALKWDRLSGRAPVCTAKGVDEIALRIREIAEEHAVPILEDPPTARALHAAVEIGQEIRRDHYKAVAAAIRFAERMRKKART